MAVSRAYGRLPLAFEANVGQADPRVAFISRTPQGTLFLAPDALTLLLKAPSPCDGPGRRAPKGPPDGASFAVARLAFVGAEPSPRTTGQEKLPGVSNIYIGNDPSRWRCGVPTYGAVRYAGLYPGVDLVVYGSGESLEYDFLVSPGADAASIAFRLEDGEGRPVALKARADGDITVSLPGGSLLHRRPRIYQTIAGSRRAVAGRYLVRSDGTVGFDVGPYDRSLPLIIDPTIDYSTFLGGSSQEGAYGIAVDSSGNAYVTGYTASSTFPVVGGTGYHGSNDLFVTKVNPAGNAWVYSTLIGGSMSDYGEGIAVDANNEAYVTGGTLSGAGFPVVNGYPVSPFPSVDYAVVVRLNAAGTIVYSTLLGGSGFDDGYGIAVDAMHRAYVVGETTSGDFPLVSSLQPTLSGGQDAFVAVIDTSQMGPGSLVFSTYLGGSSSEQGRGISLGPGGDAFVAGTTWSPDFPVTQGTAYQPSHGVLPDCYLSQIRFPATAAPMIVYSTYLGGSGADYGYEAAASPFGGAFLAGDTNSADFPLANPTQPVPGAGPDAFVSWIDTQQSGSAGLAFSTYLGGSGADTAYGLSLDAQGNPTIVGATTSSSDFPLMNPLPGQATYGGGIGDAFVASWIFPVVLTSALPPSLSLSTYLGGIDDEFAEAVAVDSSGGIYVAGATQSTNFPAVNAAQGTKSQLYDAFVTKIAAPPPTCTLTCSAGAAPTAGEPPLGVQFTATATAQSCSGTPAFYWTFGDGGTSALQNPYYTYSVPGVFTWSLTVTVDAETCTQTGTVSVCGFTCSASASPQIGFAPLPVQFAATSSISPVGCLSTVAYSWDFGDGASSVMQNPSHAYAAAGIYYWSLTATADGVLACYDYGTVEVKEAAVPGVPFSWGSNAAGQLGDGSGSDQNAPVVIGGLVDVIGLSGGGGHSLALLADQTVRAWGANGSGQVGDGSNTGRPLPVSVGGLPPVVEVSAGGSHSLALDEQGTVWAWGADASGQLGDGANSDRNQPVHLSGLGGVRALSAGGAHSLAVSGGRVVAWGENGDGQLGDGSYANSNVPIILPSPYGAMAVAAGSAHSLALGEMGGGLGENSLFVRVYAWGLNDRGQLGDGTTTGEPMPVIVPGLLNVVALAAGDKHSMALKDDGTVWAWGANDMGQLGDGTTLDRHAPVQVPGITNAVAIACGGSHSLVLLADGTLLAFGRNDSGQVGHGDNTPHPVPVPVSGLTGVSFASGGGSHSLALAICSLACDPLVPGEAQAGRPVTFDAAVTGTSGCSGLATFDWDFGDGSGHSSLQSPTHTYSSPGAYTWTFTASSGGASCTQSGVVIVCAVTCAATASPTLGLVPLAVNFTGTGAITGGCQGPVSYEWTFGDGASSSSQNPSHTYLDPGTYGWTLVVSTPSGLQCESTGVVTVCGIACSASVSPAAGFGPLTVVFSGTASVTGGCTAPLSYLWDFGDGGSSSAQNPSHTYSSPGHYDWTLTVTSGGTLCQAAGSVTVYPCNLTCTAGVSQSAGTTATTFHFTGGHSTSCTNQPSFLWDFGDGTTSSFEGADHVYAAPGVYEWTFTVAVGGVSCSKSGIVYVAVFQGAAQGFVGICGTQGFWPLNSSPPEGVQNLRVIARSDSTGVETDAQMAGAYYTFPALAPGGYTLRAEMDYLDTITVDNQTGNLGGCAAPGALTRHAVSIPVAVTLPQGGPSVFANVCFPPPLVMLHGMLECYDQFDNWAADALGRGFVVFTPNYRWRGGSASWPSRADQVLDQIQADLAGLTGGPVQLSGSAPENLTTWPPYALAGFDMGGLVARVMTSGPHRSDALVGAIGRIYLIGVPNSGSDLLPGGASGPMSVQAIVRRFNNAYPDFGSKTGLVYAVGGNRDWWGQKNSDGRVSLYSAFAITRVGCSASAFGYPVCRPYPSLVLDSTGGWGHIFPYGHYDLTGGSSTGDILDGILHEIWPSAPVVMQPENHRPESPVGQSIWGTNARSSGHSSGSISGLVEDTPVWTFTVSATDGMGVVILVTSGGGTFTLKDSNGQTMDSAHVTGEHLFHMLNPASGDWTLAVAADPGGVSWTADAVEDSPFGVTGYVTESHYDPGDAVTFRLDVEGHPQGATFQGVTADILDPSGSGVLGTVTLYDDGQHGDGAAGDSAWAGSGTAPSTLGAYPVVFTAKGLYGNPPYSFPFERLDYDTLAVVPAAHYFTGAFTDSPLDQNGNGPYDALRFTAQTALPSAGLYAVGADLLDADGNFLDHAVAVHAAAGAESATFTLTFDLSSAFCVQFGQPFQVVDLKLADATTVQALDVWTDPVETGVYEPGDFECQPGVPTPRVSALRPDEGVAGQTLNLLAGGRNFMAGASLSVDSDVTVNQTLRLTSGLLAASVTVAPTAATGFHDLTVTNTNGRSSTLQGAFEVKANQPPTVAIQTPADGYDLGQAGGAFVPVSAAATDDVFVDHVVFLLDGAPKKTDTSFPFVWLLDPATVSSGAHTLVAVAYDDAGLHTFSAPVTVIKDPPTVTSAVKAGNPFRIKVYGTNFRPGLSVYVGGDTAPWFNVKYKNAGKIVLKGGRSLKDRFPSGVAVSIRIVNADGTEVTTSYTRP